MYASLPLSCPARVVERRDAARATPKSVMRAMPSTPTRMFCGETSRWTSSSGWPSSSLQLVRGVEAGERVEHDAQHDARTGMALAAARRAREEARQRVALDVLHDQVVAAGRSSPTSRMGTTFGWWMPRGEARLVEEHLDELLLVREVRVQPLDGDEALEAADAEDRAEEHRGHAARRELGHELVAIEPLGHSALQ